jgi:PAS domain S-box-containing protein
MSAADIAAAFAARSRDAYTGDIAVTEGRREREFQVESAATTVQDRQDLLDLAQEAGNLGLFEWDVPSGTLHLSRKFLSLYGITDFNNLYQSWLKFIFREDVPRLTDLMDNAFAEQLRHSQAEFRITRPTDGALRWMEARNIIFYDANGQPLRVVGVNVDVTERKRATAQLRAFTETLEERVKERTRELEAENAARRKAEEALRQAQKMEVVGQLTGGVAHDFNNLLTVIQGGLDMIGRHASKLEASPAVARITRGKDMAMEGVRRASKLIDRLLAFARRQPLDPRTIEVNKLVSGLCQLLRRSLGEAISLETVLAGGLWRTQVDANQLENALVNLAVNARDAMPDGGKVTIETANCYLDEVYVGAITEPVAVGQYVMIAVADTGCGMDSVAREQAFEPFFTTKGVGKGTGLGLSQVYGFVRQSDGHVRIYSEVGQGTTVKIYLPRHLGDEHHVEELRRSGEASRAIGAETILVVEDDEHLRYYAIEALGDLGYQVLAVGNGVAALDVLAQDYKIDLLFTDVVMPGGMNGRQLAEQALRRRPGLKVLFTTGYTRNAIVHHGRLDPGVKMISKPYVFEELAARIRAALDQE